MTTAEEWLAEVRGLDLENLARYGVKWGRSAKGERVAIPYVENGNLIAYKVRDPSDKTNTRFDREGAKVSLWNVDVLDDRTLDEQPVIIAEGEFDALALIESGFPRALSVAHGAQSIRGILAHADRIKKSPCVILAGDADDEGQKFVRAAANALEGHPCRYVEYPAGCKDSNDVLRREGAKALVEAVNGAKIVFPSDPKGGLITGFSDAPPAPTGDIFRTGDKAADRVACWHAGFPTIVTGVPSAGKSTWLSWALWRAGKRHGLRNAVSLLETPWTVLRDHLTRLELGMLYEDLSAADRDRIHQTLDAGWRVMHRIDDGWKHDLGWIREMMWCAAVRDGCRIVTFDPWNEIDHGREAGMSETEYTNGALAKMRQWAERYDCAVTIVAHPTKMQREVGAKPYPPMGYDIGGSASWFNKAAVGLTIHRDKDDDGEFTSVINWKSKFEQLYGFSRGRVDMLFNPACMDFRPRPRLAA